MPQKSAKILVTGLPGCGKTTAIMKIAAELDREKVAGFYTQEIRRGDTRKGFSWKRLDGAQGILAHVDIKGRSMVGKYGLDVAGFEESVVPILEAAQGGALPELIELGRYRHPWVGVTGTTISPEMVEIMELPVETGVLIFYVEPDSPASRADLRGGNTELVISGIPMREGGDILVAIGETEVKDFDDLVNYLASYTSVGDSISLTIVRDGVERQVELILEERPSNR